MLIIKQLTQEDRLLWKNIRLEMLKDSPWAFGSSFEEEVNRTDEDWKRSLVDSDVFGAFEGGALIGTVGFYVYSQLKQKHKGGIFAVYLHPQFRGQKMAHVLMDAVILHGASKISQLHCAVAAGNNQAKKLYEHHGFVQYGVEPRALHIGTQFYDEILMVKIF